MYMKIKGRKHKIIGDGAGEIVSDDDHSRCKSSIGQVQLEVNSIESLAVMHSRAETSSSGE
jgi:hypothetical protein